MQILQHSFFYSPQLSWGFSSVINYLRELADEFGYFYTLGIPEDTKALEKGRINEEAFISMCDDILNEQEKMLWFELNDLYTPQLAAAGKPFLFFNNLLKNRL